MEKKLSVIVPVYNKEKFLSKCIESILNQTYKNIELILVNDGSADSSLSICNDYAKKDGRIIVVDKPNGGAASARNKGIEIATGDYIGFCDADDYLDFDMYKTLIEVMELNGYPMIDCLAKDFNEEGQLLYVGDESREVVLNTFEEAIKALYLRRGNSSLCTRVIRAEYIKNLRIPEGRRVEDFYFVILLLKHIGFVYIYRFPFYNCVLNKNSVTSAKGGSIYIDAIYFFEKSVELLGTEDFKIEQEYYLLKMYYLLFISSTVKERKIYKDFFKKYKKDLISKNNRIKYNAYLTKKEKMVLLISCVSITLARYLYLIKQLIGK